ncbi:MAG: M50 family metallopeptidase [Candidatus Avelusimicrobium sp.]|uniref:M50 family metallopeptidase n=1 Tax=Candidatus Avelusimicrobium sp. TaxID=3048833 RepID=UPI003F10450C
MKPVKLLCACLLLPTAFFALTETGLILLAALGHLNTAVSFVAGALVYMGIHYGYYNFSRPYVFMHEMTHAVAALLCGCRIKDVSVREDSGYVKMDRCNAFVVLAPYFIPGYVILTVSAYVIGDLFADLTPYRQVFLFLVGFFTTFHFVQTFKTLFEADQPDLKLAGGKLFSVVMIVLCNLMVLALLVKGLFPETVSLSRAVERVFWGTVNVWRILVNYIIDHIVNAG